MAPIPPEVISRAIGRYRAGCTAIEAAKGLMGESTLRKHMALRGVKGHRSGRGVRPTLTVAMINRAIKDYLAGKTLEQAAEGICTVFTLRRHMEARGIPRRKGCRVGIRDIERTVALYRAWKRRTGSIREAAEELGIDKNTLMHHVGQADKFLNGKGESTAIRLVVSPGCGTIRESKRAA